jgi:hypothetical protein
MQKTAAEQIQFNQQMEKAHASKLRLVKAEEDLSSLAKRASEMNDLIPKLMAEVDRLSIQDPAGKGDVERLVMHRAELEMAQNWRMKTLPAKRSGLLTAIENERLNLRALFLELTPDGDAPWLNSSVPVAELIAAADSLLWLRAS